MATRYIFGIALATLLTACSQTVIESQNVLNIMDRTVQRLEKDGEISVSYFLPRQRAKVTIESKKNTDETCTQSAKFEILKVEPDTEHHYIAFFKHGITRDDVIDLKIKDGLLSGAETTVTDRTLDIVLELAKSAGLGLPTIQSVPAAQPPETECAAFVRSAVIDPTVTEADNEISSLLAESNFLIKIERPNSAASMNFTATDSKYPGLVYRRKLPYIVTICEKNGGSDNCGTEKQETQYRLPDSNSIMVMPIKSGRFVTTKHKLEFDQGEPTQVKIEQDSEVIALVSFPLTLAKAILSVPAEILQLKFDYKSKETNLVKAQKTLIDAQQELLKAKNRDPE